VLTLVSKRPGAESTFAWLLAFLRPYRRRAAVLGALSVAEVGLRALTPWPFKMVVDRLVRGDRGALAVFEIVGFGLGVQLAHQFALMLHTRIQSRLAQYMVFDVRSRLFNHLQYLSLSHHGKSSTADSVYRLEADAACAESLLLGALFPSVFSALTLVVMFTILARLDPMLAALSMAIVPLLYLSVRSYTRRMRPFAERAKQLDSAVVGRLYESLSAIRLVKAFTREEYELARFERVAKDADEERDNIARRESGFGFAVGAITAAGGALVLAIGALHVMDHRLSVGTLLVVVAYLGFVYGPLSAIATTAGSLHHALASAGRVRDVLMLARETDADGAIVAPAFAGAITFEDVSFAYGPGAPVLDHVNLSIAAGETVAIVGPSGAGKSTLVSLIGRMYEPTGGRLLIDGVDARRYDLKSLRNQIAVVLQDAVLF
jgi:ATP-binding cassette, subfamily B, bacterial